MSSTLKLSSKVSSTYVDTDPPEGAFPCIDQSTIPKTLGNIYTCTDAPEGLEYVIDPETFFRPVAWTLPFQRLSNCDLSHVVD